MDAWRHDDAEAFARLSRELLAEPQTEQTLQRVVEMAVQVVPGCDYAGITLRHKDRLETPAASDPIVDELDNLQYALDEGPCVSSVRREETFVIRDNRTEQRWPMWSPRAAEVGVLSGLSLPLEAPAHVIGGLNLYSRAAEAFDNDALLTGQIYAMHAGSAIAANSQVANLHNAMRSRHLIGMAQGMLMTRYRLSEEQAFRFLSRVSQQENVKLRSVAERVVAEIARDGQGP
jgi:GAF domain-containing protein